MPTSEIDVVPFRDDLTPRARKVPKLEGQAITLARAASPLQGNVAARLKRVRAGRSYRLGPLNRARGRREALLEDSPRSGNDGTRLDATVSTRDWFAN